MNQIRLFELTEKTKPSSKYTCRSCKHRYKHQYGKMFYCSEQRQRGTAYGDKKIKAGDVACELYKPK